MNSVYNLKVVLNETGIKPDVLRAWERRYGLPKPNRSAGGHRLYSEMDIEIIRWLIARQKEGMSISNAVELWKSKAAKEADPFRKTYLDGNEYSHSTAMATYTLNSTSMSGIDDLRSQWLSACLDFNETAAEQVLNQAFALYSIEDVCMRVMQRGLSEIGTMWYENRASVQQEHFTSVLATRRIDSILLSCPPPTRAYSIIVGCPSNEWHTFSTILLSLFIRRRGFNVIYLGANVPTSHIMETINAVNARLVILTSQMLNSAANLQHSAAFISGFGIPVAFGGRIFTEHPDMVDHIAGYYLGNQFDGAVGIVEKLMETIPIPISYKTYRLSQEYDKALSVFITHRAFIEAILDRRFSEKGNGSMWFPDVHTTIANNIVAALTLGDVAFLDSEMDWLRQMLRAQNIPQAMMYSYMETLAEVVNQHVGGQAPVLNQWFERILNEQKHLAPFVEN